MRIQNKEKLTSHGNIEGRKIVAELLDIGLDAIDPYYRIKKLVEVKDNKIILHTSGFEMRGDPHSGDAVYDLADYDRVFVIGAAKGIQRAALAMEEILGDILSGGFVIGKHGEDIICKKIDVTLAGHPVPDEYCIEGCKKIERLVNEITESDLVFTIFGSGCGSLFTYPVDSISIKDISDFTHMMQIEKGVPTSDLNCIRTHIDKFKGGRITRLLKKATLINLTTADPSKLSTPVTRMTYSEMLKINTFFPTVATASTYEDCINIIKKWDAWDKTPESIKKHLMSATDENMDAEEYEKTGARFLGLVFKDSTIYPAVRQKAKEFGYKCVMLSEYMEAEAREAGFVDGNMALCCERMGEPFKAPIVLMSSGENVVTVGAEHGIGGRNQEYCIGAAMKIAGSDSIVVGAVDTDGTDGPGGLLYKDAPSCLAGAIVDGSTMAEAKNRAIDLWQALKSHDTSKPLWDMDCGVYAKSNVSALDLKIILIK
jgi:glycerate-2-kinase